MAKCPSCKADTTVLAAHCPACNVSFEDSRWRPLATSKEEVAQLQRQAVRIIMGPIAAQRIAMPRPDCIRLRFAGGTEGIGCAMIMLVVIFGPIVWGLILDKRYVILAIIFGLPALAFLWRYLSRFADGGRPGVYLYPNEGYIVKWDWFRTTVHIGIPMTIDLEPFEARSRSYTNPNHAALTGYTANPVEHQLQLVVAGPRGKFPLASGPEADLNALEQCLRACMQAATM